MLFRDRRDAGRRLGATLQHVQPPAYVLAIPRGGVVVGAEVADLLDAPLDVIIPRKLRAPENPELAVGAVAHDGTVYLDPGVEGSLSTDSTYLREEIQRQQEEISRRMMVYRGTQVYPDLTEHTVSVIDDGIATGSTIIAALRAVRRMGCRAIVAAVPVAPSDAVQRLRAEADEVVCLLVPIAFYAVGQFYEDFAQTTDDEVIALLRRRGEGRGPEPS
ncbi:MAG TPA: phosphoribosyltransferase [bacterium]|nr:phosphoribosyltransferase [bacterium]